MRASGARQGSPAAHEGNGSGAGRPRWRRLLSVGAGLAMLAALAVLLPDLVALVPRPVQQPIIERALLATLAGYEIALALALPGVVLSATLAYRARRRGVRRTPWARLFLLCASVLFGLALVEGAAAARDAWARRLPRLDGSPVASPSRVASRPTPALPDRFGPGDREDSLNLVVIGESSAQGYPYNPRLSIGQIVAWQLGRVFPRKRVEANVLAQGGLTLEDMHDRLARLTRRPDALIVYCGHNEFQARYAWSRTARPDSASDDGGAAPGLGPLDRLGRLSPLCRLVRGLVEKNRLDVKPPPVHHDLIDWPMCTPAEYDAILTDFRRRLEAIVAYCDRLDILPILVIPPANDAGFEPSRSVLRASATPDERREATAQFWAARRIEDDDPGRAVALFEALAARWPEFAEAHFRLARLLERAGDWPQANRHYILARDADGLPLRFPSRFMEVYREVAARHGCPLIDGPAVLRALSPHGILDDNLFHDVHHPVLVAHVALAQAVLHTMKGRKALGWADQPEPTIDPCECLAHFGVTTSDWFVLCQRAQEFYRFSSQARYDPAWRLARSRRYARAALKVGGPDFFERAGVPGLGCRPEPWPGPLDDWQPRPATARAGRN